MIATVPVHCFSITFTIRTGDKQAARIMCKPKWDRRDKDYYRKFVRENLLPFDSFQLSTNSSIAILEPLSHLNAVSNRLPLTVYQNSNLSSKSRRSITDPCQRRFMRLLKHAIYILAWWEWRKAGEPTDKDDPTVEQRKVRKQKLQKEQRQEAA